MDYSYNNSYTGDSYDSYNPFNPSTERELPPPPFRSSSSLLAVHRTPIKKHPIAPLPPTPPKVYKVDPVDFRDVVQKLTGKPTHDDQFHLTRLQEVAPPPLIVGHEWSGFMGAGAEEEKQRKSYESTFGGLSPLGFSLSPASLAWCSSILMSPGPVSSFEPSALLY